MSALEEAAIFSLRVDRTGFAEVVITIGGKRFWLYRAIDQDADVPDILVQARRNTKAAKRFLFQIGQIIRLAPPEPKMRIDNGRFKSHRQPQRFLLLQ